RRDERPPPRPAARSARPAHGEGDLAERARQRPDARTRRELLPLLEREEEGERPRHKRQGDQPAADRRAEPPAGERRRDDDGRRQQQLDEQESHGSDGRRLTYLVHRSTPSRGAESVRAMYQ